MGRGLAPLFLIERVERGGAAEKSAGERGTSRRSEVKGAVLNIAGEFTVLLRGRLGLDGSTSVSPRMMVGSERGKELNGSLRTSGGSVSSIGPGLLVILND